MEQEERGRRTKFVERKGGNPQVKVKVGWKTTTTSRQVGAASRYLLLSWCQVSYPVLIVSTLP
jgi:hypothetical protein